jgi:hypothetical protein
LETGRNWPTSHPDFANNQSTLMTKKVYTYAGRDFRKCVVDDKHIARGCGIRGVGLISKE